MTDRLLYALAIPDGAQLQSRAQLRRRLSEQGRLSGGRPAVNTISLQPGERLLSGYYADRYAALSASEVEELADAGGIDAVPFADRTSDEPLDGYYQLKDAQVEQSAPARTDRVRRFDVTLTQEGTRRDQLRAVEAEPQTVTNPFGSGGTQEIAISLRAERVKWYDSQGGTIEDATVQRRVDGEHDELVVYDTSEPSFSSPTLIYDIDYRDEWPTDVRVWDDYNREKTATLQGDGDPATVGTATVGNATVAESRTVESTWQRVFSTGHNFVGRPVLESERLRLVADVGDDDPLLAYRWNEGDQNWDIVDLGVSNWRLRDVDITHIGLSRIEAQLEFRDTSGSSRYNINVALGRGDDESLFTEPENEGSAPSGLVDRLDPIAKTTDTDTAERASLVDREEVNR